MHDQLSHHHRKLKILLELKWLTHLMLQDVIEELCTVIGVTGGEMEMEEFSLYCIVEGDTFTMPLAREEYILDVTTELHKNQQVYRPVLIYFIFLHTQSVNWIFTMYTIIFWLHRIITNGICLYILNWKIVWLFIIILKIVEIGTSWITFKFSLSEFSYKLRFKYWGNFRKIQMWKVS